MVTPALTAYAAPLRRMAHSAVRLPTDRIEARRDAPRRAVFELELRDRASCAPPGPQG